MKLSELFKEMERSGAAAILEEIERSGAAATLKEMERSGAAATLKEMERSGAAATLKEMERSGAAAILKEMERSGAAAILESNETTRLFSKVDIAQYIKNIKPSHDIIENHPEMFQLMPKSIENYINENIEKNSIDGRHFSPSIDSESAVKSIIEANNESILKYKSPIDQISFLREQFPAAMSFELNTKRILSSSYRNIAKDSSVRLQNSPDTLSLIPIVETKKGVEYNLALQPQVNSLSSIFKTITSQEAESFISHLDQFPMMAVKHRIGIKIFKEIQGLQEKELLKFSRGDFLLQMQEKKQSF